MSLLLLGHSVLAVSQNASIANEPYKQEAACSTTESVGALFSRELKKHIGDDSNLKGCGVGTFYAQRVKKNHWSLCYVTKVNHERKVEKITIKVRKNSAIGIFKKYQSFEKMLQSIEEKEKRSDSEFFLCSHSKAKEVDLDNLKALIKPYENDADYRTIVKVSRKWLAKQGQKLPFSFYLMRDDQNQPQLYTIEHGNHPKGSYKYCVFATKTESAAKIQKLCLSFFFLKSVEKEALINLCDARYDILNHEALCFPEEKTVKTIGQDTEKLCLVAKRYEGSLDKLLLDKEKPLKQSSYYYIFNKMKSALEKLYASHYIHGDVHFGNFFYERKDPNLSIEESIEANKLKIVLGDPDGISFLEGLDSQKVKERLVMEQSDFYSMLLEYSTHYLNMSSSLFRKKQLDLITVVEQEKKLKGNAEIDEVIQSVKKVFSDLYNTLFSF